MRRPAHLLLQNQRAKKWYVWCKTGVTNTYAATHKLESSMSLTAVTWIVTSALVVARVVGSMAVFALFVVREIAVL
jgi:hypothetical protein